MVYMAGADHLPLKFLPPRQLIGPRPPLPPMRKAAFFTLGRTTMQSALAIRLEEMLLSLSIACNTAAAFLRVSSSSPLSAPHAGRFKRTSTREVRKLSTAVFLYGIGLNPPLERKHNRC